MGSVRKFILRAIAILLIIPQIPLNISAQQAQSVFTVDKNFDRGNVVLFDDFLDLKGGQDLTLEAKSVLNKYLLTTNLDYEPSLNFNPNDVTSVNVINSTSTLNYFFKTPDKIEIQTKTNQPFTNSQYKIFTSIGLLTEGENLLGRNLLKENIILVIIELLNLIAPSFVETNADAISGVYDECEPYLTNQISKPGWPLWLTNLTSSFRCIFTVQNLFEILCDTTASSILVCGDLIGLAWDILDYFFGFLIIGEGLIATSLVTQFIRNYMDESELVFDLATFNFGTSKGLYLATSSYEYDWIQASWGQPVNTEYLLTDCSTLANRYSSSLTLSQCQELLNTSENNIYAAGIELFASLPAGVDPLEFGKVNGFQYPIQGINWSLLVFTYCQNSCTSYKPWFLYRNNTQINYDSNNCPAPDYCLTKDGVV